MNKIVDTAVRLYDGFANVLSGLQTSADSHSAGATWFARPISQQEIESSWRTSWLSRKVHSTPVNDVIRPWRRWNATPEQITAIEREERRLGLRQRVRKALLWSRLYGGAAIVIGIANDDPTQPLDVAKVKRGGLTYLHVLTRHEITVQGVNLDPGSPQYGEPLAYVVNGGNGAGLTLHPSRVVRFVHGELPDNLAFAEQTWGDPMLMALRDCLVNADSAQGNFAALTSKARTSTLKIPGLVNMISTATGEQNLIKKTQLAKQFESLFHVNLISAPARAGEAGEEWQHDQVNFANLAEIGTWFIQNVAGASDIPLTRLFGMSAAGLNSTGDGDLSNYHASLDTGRELDLRPRLEMIDEILIRSATNERDEAIWFEFQPFEVDSDETKVKNAQGRATALKTLSEAGSVPSDVLMKITKAQLIDSGDYPGAEDAYAEYEADGGTFEIEASEPSASNDNTIAATTEGLVAQGRSASVAARDARVMLADASPMPLYVYRMVLNRDEIQAWATEQGLGGLQPDLHATILYSRQPVDWISMGTTWADKDGDGSGKLQVTAGGPRCVEPLGDRTAVLMFSNTDMQWRHEEMVRLGASHDYSDFTLHISLTDKPVDLASVVPYRGKIDFGPEIFSVIDEKAI